MKPSFLAKLLDRIEHVSPDELQTYLQQLAREKGFLEVIFNTLQEGVLVIDATGKVLYFNPSIQRLIGLPDNALGHGIAEYLKELDWKKILRERRVVSRDLEVYYPDMRFLNFYLVPLEEPGQEFMGYALIFHDITATRQRTREVIESEKVNALTLLAAGVAHELGNPLNSLHIHLQLLERDLKKIEGAKGGRLVDSVRVAQAEITRLDNIINQFLRAVRPGQPDRKPAQVNDLVRESIDFLRPEIADRDILVETELAKDLPLLPLDGGQMKQAIYNLIKNSIQAMSVGGILRVRTERNDTHLLISFIDNGCGIAPENVSRIFEPYFTTKDGGSGLGLFIIRRIVREHGGDLILESDPGRGTTARIVLPLAERRVRMLPASGSTVKTETDKEEHHD